MSGVPFSRTVATILASAIALICLPTAAEEEKSTAPEPASRSPLVRLAIEIPQTHGPWRMVIVNDDSVPVRVTADARRLSLWVRQPSESTYHRCELPSAMTGSPRERALVLDPGARYVESFDPRMYCWGSISEKLSQGASVTAFLGWKRDDRREKRKQPQVPPFAVEPVIAPALFVPAKQIVSLTSWLPEGDVVQANPDVREPPPKFVGAPDLRLSTPRWADATDHREARLTATLTNVGDRDALVHLRPDDLEVRLQRPDGTVVQCGPGTGYRAAVRDFFITIKPGKSSSVSNLLSELCPSGAITRPGLYLLSATLRVRDDGSAFRLQAITGDFAAARSTLLRVRTARDPFHASPPQPRPPKPRGKSGN